MCSDSKHHARSWFINYSSPMYQSSAYMQRPAGCFNCFGYSNNAPMVPQGYGYNSYVNPLATSTIGMPMAPMAPMVPMVDPTYQSRTIIAPPIINKAVMAVPPKTSRIEYIPYETREVVYDTVEKLEVVPMQRTYTQYEQLRHQETYPVERMVTDYYAMEYLTEFMPQVTSDRVVDYVQQQVIHESINYVPYETQRVIPVPPVVQAPQMYGINQPMMVPQMAPPMVLPVGPPMVNQIGAASVYSVSPSVATVAPMQGIQFTASNVSPGLHGSQSMYNSAISGGNGGYGYGMGPTVGTVVGTSTQQPGYGVTAMTY